MEVRTKEVIEFIASFLVDATGNEIFEKWKVKRKIFKILEEDKKNIRRIFYTVDNSDLYNLVEEFILHYAFKEVSFYSAVNLTAEQEEKLWIKFGDFIKKEMGSNWVDNTCKEKIIKCVNLHNKAINSIIMDPPDIFHMKMLQTQNKAINESLNHIIDTLNTETKLQDEDDELNFFVEQLEMIMKSYRFDINHFRRIQIVSICGAMVILLFMSIFIPLSLEHIINIYPIIIMSLFFIIVVVLLLIFWIYISLKSQKIENHMEAMRVLLWEIHFKIYKKQIDKKCAINTWG